MEINIGVMCSCMPALRPFFVRVMPRLSIQSFRRKYSRSRYHQQNSDPVEEGRILELERYRGMDANDNAIAQRSPRTENVVDEGAGARNIIAF